MSLSWYVAGIAFLRWDNLYGAEAQRLEYNPIFWNILDC